MNSALYSGWIGHRRFSPRRHEFRYRIGLLYLDLSEQDAVLALSPLAGMADVSMVLSAGGISPFDSHVGTLALLNVLIAGAADELREGATDRLDRAEAAWSAGSHLVDR